MHPVGPHVHVVDLGQVAAGEAFRLVLPLGRQAGDHRRRQTGRGAKELLQGRGEILGAHPVQVHQRQHLGHLRRPAGPRRDDRGPETAPLTCGLVDPAVIHPRRHHLDRPCPGHDVAGLGVAVADHQPAPVLVDLVDQPRHIRIDLGLQRRGQHPPGPLTDQLIQGRTHLRARLVVSYYSQHRRSFLAGVPPPTSS